MSDVTGWNDAPSQGRVDGATALRRAQRRSASMLEGMAKPMPMEPPNCEKIVVLMPISRPFMLTSAPPELPGLIAASVWMKKPKSETPI